MSLPPISVRGFNNRPLALAVVALTGIVATMLLYRPAIDRDAGGDQAALGLWNYAVAVPGIGSVSAAGQCVHRAGFYTYTSGRCAAPR